jgi:hypothetical protein
MACLTLLKHECVSRKRFQFRNSTGLAASYPWRQPELFLQSDSSEGLDVDLRKSNKGKPKQMLPTRSCFRADFVCESLKAVPIANNPGTSIGNGRRGPVKLKRRRSNELISGGWQEGMAA